MLTEKQNPIFRKNHRSELLNKDKIICSALIPENFSAGSPIFSSLNFIS